jgi:hypothetical protein
MRFTTNRNGSEGRRRIKNLPEKRERQPQEQWSASPSAEKMPCMATNLQNSAVQNSCGTNVSVVY